MNTEQVTIIKAFFWVFMFNQEKRKILNKQPKILNKKYTAEKTTEQKMYTCKI